MTEKPLRYRPACHIPPGALAVTFALALAFALGAVVPRSAVGAQGQSEIPAQLVPARILAVNDLHGALDPPRQVGGRSVGGAASLAAHLRAQGAGQPNVALVGVGDLVGGSPPLSGLLDDEPTMRVLNSLGFLVDTPGNHDFDHGLAEMLRLRRGDCRANSPPVQSTDCFEGARHPEIAANLLDAATGQSVFPPSLVWEVDGVRVGFVGATHPDLARLTTPSATAGVVLPEAAGAVNAAIHNLQAEGVHALVVLVHDGGFVDGPRQDLRGPVVPFLDALDPDVDVVLTAHTHQGYVLRRGAVLVTQAYANGTALARVDLELDPATGDVASSQAALVTTYDDLIPPDPVALAIVEDARAKVQPRLTRVVGVAGANLSRSQTRAGESAVGDLVADAFRWRMDSAIGLTNPGGLRADLRAGLLTWGELNTLLPFGNEVVTLALRGDTLVRIFEQQWTIERDGSERYRPLQVSGLRVAWDGSRPLGQRIVAVEDEAGQPLAPASVYTVATQSFLADGGDGFSAFAGGAERVSGPTDVEALADYVERQLPDGFVLRTGLRLRRFDDPSGRER